MSTTRVNFRIPEDLVEKADIVAEITHKNRTDIVVEALREYLRDLANEETIKEDVTDLYLNDEIGFKSLESIIGRQDAEAVRASKKLLDEGETLADALAELGTE